MHQELEKLIDLAIADGILTDKKKQVLEKKREELGVDLDEFEMVLEAKLHQRNQVNNQVIFPAPPQEKDLKQEAIDNLGKMNIPYNQGTLIINIQDGNTAVVKLLLQAGLNPNNIYIQKIDKKDVSFLAINSAISYGHIEIVKLLIEYGADITKGNNKDENIPIIQAIKLKNIEIVEILAPKIELNFVCTPSWTKVTPLIYAIDLGHISIAKIIIKNNADINKSANSNLETPLILAIKNKNIDAVNLLIENGADVNKTRKDGTSPILIAHQRKLDDILRILIYAGSSPLTENELLNSATLKSKILNNVESSIDYTKKTLWPKIVIGIVLAVIVIRGCSEDALNYENPSEVKEFLVKHAYKANEGDIEVVLHFFKSGEGSMSAYNKGTPVGNDQIFHFDIGASTDDGGVKIETAIGQMQLEDDGKISYLYNGNWFFFREWEY